MTLPLGPAYEGQAKRFRTSNHLRPRIQDLRTASTPSRSPCRKGQLNADLRPLLKQSDGAGTHPNRDYGDADAVQPVGIPDC